MGFGGAGGWARWNQLNESIWLDDEQIEFLYQSTLTIFFLGQNALLALPPWLPCLPLKWTTANLTTPFLFSPPFFFFVFTCLLSFSCSKACHLWQRSQLTPWSWPTLLAMQGSYHAGQWLSCPLFPSVIYRPRLLPHLHPHPHHPSAVLLQTPSPRHLCRFLRRIFCHIRICSRWVLVS